jgi:hypothetical protein
MARVSSFTSGRLYPLKRPQVGYARPGPTHLQPGKVRPAIGIAGYDLAAEHLGRPLVEQLYDGSETLENSCPFRLNRTTHEPNLRACTR